MLSSKKFCVQKSKSEKTFVKKKLGGQNFFGLYMEPQWLNTGNFDLLLSDTHTFEQGTS